MNDTALRIAIASVQIPISVPRRRPRGAVEIEMMGIEIHSGCCRVWFGQDCGDVIEFEPGNRRLFGNRALTDLPYFPQVFRFMTEQYVANRTGHLGEFVRPFIVAMERDLATKDGSCVYFAQADDRVKIGWSKHVASRLAQLQTGSPTPLKLLGAIPGARAAERRLHEQFAHLRLTGEWFRAAPELLDHIAQATR